MKDNTYDSRVDAAQDQLEQAIQSGDAQRIKQAEHALEHARNSTRSND